MAESKKSGGFGDPFAAWQKYMGDAEKRMNEVMNDFMATPQFNESSKYFLQALTKYQQTMNEAGGKYFAAINLPTRDDLAQLGTQLGVVEERLNRIEALLTKLAGEAPAPDKPRARPKRTKKPPKAADAGKAGT